MIKVKNLPEECANAPLVSVKPKILLILLLVVGLILIIFYPYYYIIGMCLLLISIFCIFALPDHELMRFTKDYIVLYNNRDRSLCYMVYWDEIVNWQYEYHTSSDLLVLSLIDGSTQSVDAYSKSSIITYMNTYAPGKEVKTSRRKEVA